MEHLLNLSQLRKRAYHAIDENAIARLRKDYQSPEDLNGILKQPVARREIAALYSAYPSVRLSS